MGKEGGAQQRVSQRSPLSPDQTSQTEHRKYLLLKYIEKTQFLSENIQYHLHRVLCWFLWSGCVSWSWYPHWFPLFSLLVAHWLRVQRIKCWLCAWSQICQSGRQNEGEDDWHEVNHCLAGAGAHRRHLFLWLSSDRREVPGERSHHLTLRG